MLMMLRNVKLQSAINGRTNRLHNNWHSNWHNEWQHDIKHDSHNVKKKMAILMIF